MGKITLYHNTSNTNAIAISKQGIIAGLRKDVYGEGNEGESMGIWCTTVRGYGYGGATVTFEIDVDNKNLVRQNDVEYTVYQNIPSTDIIDIDLVVAHLKTVNRGNKDDNFFTTTMESEIPIAIAEYGKEKVLGVLKNHQNKFVEPYNYEQLVRLIETGNKYCKGTINLTESKHKVEEASRNELLAITKSDTITRYNKSVAYKGFSISDIDTTNVLRDNTLRVTCRVGNYYDTVLLEDILYWVQIVAEEEHSPYHAEYQITTKGVTKAIMNSIDGMDIKVDCNCGDFTYRFAYQASVLGYKYGKQETRPANIRNPHNYGALCKHLTALLSNKKWLQQVTGKLMDWIEQHIDDVNKFLKVKEGQELTLPNELARRNAKDSWKNRRKASDEAQKNKEDSQNDNENDVENNNTDGNSSDVENNSSDNTTIDNTKNDENNNK